MSRRIFYSTKSSLESTGYRVFRGISPRNRETKNISSPQRVRIITDGTKCRVQIGTGPRGVGVLFNPLLSLEDFLAIGKLDPKLFSHKINDGVGNNARIRFSLRYSNLKFHPRPRTRPDIPLSDKIPNVPTKRSKSVEKPVHERLIISQRRKSGVLSVKFIGENSPVADLSFRSPSVGGYKK